MSCLATVSKEQENNIVKDMNSKNTRIELQTSLGLWVGILNLQLCLIDEQV